jgi:rubrerythrin
MLHENAGVVGRSPAGITLAQKKQYKGESMNPRLLLDRLIECERRVRRVYLTLGDRTDFPAEVRFFWNCMAEDERHHLAILERSASLLDLMDSPPETSEEALTGVAAKIAAAEAAVERPDLSSDEAFRQALNLESSEPNSLDEAWFGGFRPTLGSLLQAMAPEEEMHIHRLIEAAQAFSADTALHSQAVEVWLAYQQQRLGRSR